MASSARKLLTAAARKDEILTQAVNQFGYSMTVAAKRDGRETSEIIDRLLARKIIEFMDEDSAQPYEKREKQEGLLYLSPSSFGSCELQGVYRIFGIPESIPNHDVAHVGRMSRIFKVGDSAHYRISAYFALMGILTSREKSFTYELTPDITLSGRLDDTVLIYPQMSWMFKKGKIIPNLAGTPVEYVVDIKSAKNRSFEEMRKAGCPSDQYRMQLEIYMRVTGLPGILFVENKDTQEVMEFLVKPSNKVWQAVIDDAEKRLHSWKTGLIPERGEEYHPDRFPCSFCDYREYCWNKFHDEKQIEIMEMHRERTEKNATKARTNPVKSKAFTTGKKFKLKLRR